MSKARPEKRSERGINPPLIFQRVRVKPALLERRPPNRCQCMDGGGDEGDAGSFGSSGDCGAADAGGEAPTVVEGVSADPVLELAAEVASDIFWPLCIFTSPR